MTSLFKILCKFKCFTALRLFDLDSSALNLAHVRGFYGILNKLEEIHLANFSSKFAIHCILSPLSNELSISPALTNGIVKLSVLVGLSIKKAMRNAILGIAKFYD